jgi:ribosomal protein S18 acetylase RimI-like enzyme
MEIRRATVDEWEASRDVRLRALADAPDAFCSTLERERGFDDETWKSRLERAETLFAWDGDVVSGTATGKPDPHEDGGREIVAMWVAPEHRSTGIASALIAALVESARSQGASAVALWVAGDNDRARRAYESSGFVLTGEREEMRPGVDELRMRLPLLAG